MLAIARHEGRDALTVAAPGNCCIALKNTAAAQEFVFLNQLTAWVKLTELREASPLGDNGVTEWGE